MYDDYDEYSEFDNIPSVVDFAYEVIGLYEKTKQYERKIEHLEKLLKIHEESSERSREHGKKMMDVILSAAIDPRSPLNKIKEATND